MQVISIMGPVLFFTLCIIELNTSPNSTNLLRKNGYPSQLKIVGFNEQTNSGIENDPLNHLRFLSENHFDIEEHRNRLRYEYKYVRNE